MGTDPRLPTTMRCSRCEWHKPTSVFVADVVGRTTFFSPWCDACTKARELELHRLGRVVVCQGCGKPLTTVPAGDDLALYCLDCDS